MDKYLSKSERIQQRLLRKLKRKEAKIVKQLAAKDSALYAQYLSTGSFDSLAHLQKDSTYLAKAGKMKNTLVDSLKGVSSFLKEKQQQAHNLQGKAGALGMEVPYADKLNTLQQKSGALQSTDKLVQQKLQSLLQLNNVKGLNLNGLSGLQKQYYYAGEK